MFCTSCGNENVSGAKFCKFCGAQLENNSDIAAKQQPRNAPQNGNQTVPPPVTPISMNPSTWSESGVVEEKSHKVPPMMLIGQIALFVIVIGLIIVVLFVSGIFDGDDDSSDRDHAAIENSDSDTSEYDESNEETGSIENSAIETLEMTTVVTVATTRVTTTATKSTTVTTTTEASAEEYYYEVVYSKVTWSEAKAAAESAGGRLAEIHSQSDWNTVTSLCSQKGVNYVWLGGKIVQSNSGTYFSWLSGGENDFIFSYSDSYSDWQIENGGHWYSGESSFYDGGTGILEPYLMLWNIDNVWSLNDNSDEALQYYKSIGYVIEYNW